MGLSLYINLFHNVPHDEVYHSFIRFCEQEGHPVVKTGDEDYRFTLHQFDGRWTLLELPLIWDKTIEREALLHVSSELKCIAFRIFVYDGDYWGYECFSNGATLDRFVQDPEAEPICFPGGPCSGDPEIICSQLPFLKASDIRPYLVQFPFIDISPNLEPGTEEWREAHRRERRKKEATNIKAMPGDEFTRFDECAMLDFIRRLGVQVKLRSAESTSEEIEYLHFLAPPWCHFWLEGLNTRFKLAKFLKEVRQSKQWQTKSKSGEE